MSNFDKVILISIDNLRYDCVGYQPDKRELKKYGLVDLLKTPTLDSIAEKSICFTNCISTNTYTTSAHASVFTGLYPPRHGVRAFYDTKLSQDVTTLAEIFKMNGYITVMATDTPEHFEPLSLTRGFDHIIVRSDPDLLQLIDRYKNEKMFIFVHFFDVHEPFLYSECPPFDHYNDDYYELMNNLSHVFNKEITEKDPLRAWQSFWKDLNQNINYLFRPYVEGVGKFDQGRLKIFIDALKTCGIWDNALIVIFSDHGEGRCFYQNHDYFAHAGELYDSVIRVPLIINMQESNYKVDDNLISIVDIFSMIISLTGVSVFLEYETDSKWPVQRNTCFSEVWVTLRNGDYSEWLLFQRSLRTINKKFLLVGKQEDFQSQDFYNLSEEDYIRSLYRKILTRIEDESGMYNANMALKNDEISRLGLLKNILKSKEYKSRPRLYMYDLVNDTEENHPLLVGDNLLTFTEAHEFLKEILKIEAQADNTKKIFTQPQGQVSETEEKIIKEWEGRVDEKLPGASKQDKEKIINRLRDLGYF